MKSEKLVIIINGIATAGKDTLCNAYLDYMPSVNISAIDCILPIARNCGWDGIKDDKGRRLLSDLKQSCIKYNNLPLKYLQQQYEDFLKDNISKVLFVHIREAEEIEAFKAIVSIPVTTLLVVGREEAESIIWNNPADSNVKEYNYDIVFDNSGDLQISIKKFRSIIGSILDRNNNHNMLMDKLYLCGQYKI